MIDNKYYYSDGTTSSVRDWSKILHRENEPAIEGSNGDKSWFINGKRHREDGPAIEFNDGTKHWLINGKYHRENGPAVKFSSGAKSWFINGKRHREDGPAREWSDGIVEYYLNDKRYSKEDFDKEIEKMKKFKEDKYYYSDGTTSSKRDSLKILHREDGPAIEWSDGSNYWFINGKRHREDGPAVEFSNGYVEYWLNDEFYSKKYFDKEIINLNKLKEDKFYYSDGTTSLKRDYSKVLHRENGPAVEYSDGTKSWYINGKFHREDGPAIEYSNGDKNWYINGKLHREDGPAVVYNTGSVYYWLNDKQYSKEDFDKEIAEINKPKKDKFYYSDGTTSSEIDCSKILHREDGPACEWYDGTKYWYINDKLHREDGPAIEYSNGTKYWHINDKLHREDGPAIENSNGSKHWYINGKLHREDGPAVEYNDGTVEYWLNNKNYLNKKIYNTALNKCENTSKIELKKFKSIKFVECFDSNLKIDIDNSYWEVEYTNNQSRTLRFSFTYGKNISFNEFKSENYANNAKQFILALDDMLEIEKTLSKKDRENNYFSTQLDKIATLLIPEEKLIQKQNAKKRLETIKKLKEKFASKKSKTANVLTRIISRKISKAILLVTKNITIFKSSAMKDMLLIAVSSILFNTKYKEIASEMRTDALAHLVTGALNKFDVKNTLLPLDTAPEMLILSVNKDEARS